MVASTSKSNVLRDDWDDLTRSPTYPGMYVKEGILEAYGLTQQELADAIGMSRLSINEIVKGKRSITEATALKLARLTGTNVTFWLDLQRSYNLWNAARNEADKIAEIKPLKRR